MRLKEIKWLITWIFDPQYKIVTENVHKTVNVDILVGDSIGAGGLVSLV